jgi:hypothetical protein
MGAVTTLLSSGAAGPIEWGVAGRALGGADVSGDLHLVAPHAAGLLVAVADGLGHGPMAALAARTAMTVLAGHAGGSVTELMTLCHEALRPTRGAVLSIASFDVTAGTVVWLGVGNVEGVMIRREGSARESRKALLLRGGVIGHRIPPLRAATLSTRIGDVLIFATDGIAAGFAAIETGDRPPQDLADEILRRCGKDTDDALVLVARYRGASW